MIGAIIALSIISFILACSTVMFMVMYFGAQKSLDLAERFVERGDHALERFADSIGDLATAIEKTNE